MKIEKQQKPPLKRAVYCSNIEGGKATIAMQERHIAEGLSFTQETILSGQRPLRMVKETKAAGYYVRLFYVAISSPEEALERIRNRVAKCGHDIPMEDVLRQFAARFEALTKILPYCDEAVLFDNENGFVEVAEYRNGEFAWGITGPHGWRNCGWKRKSTCNL